MAKSIDKFGLDPKRLGGGGSGGHGAQCDVDASSAIDFACGRVDAKPRLLVAAAADVKSEVQWLHAVDDAGCRFGFEQGGKDFKGFGGGEDSAGDRVKVAMALDHGGKPGFQGDVGCFVGDAVHQKGGDIARSNKRRLGV